MKMVKYLFSDVTKGVPEHIGCLEQLLDWLRKTLNAFGAVCLFMFVVEFILFIIVIMLIGIVIQEGRAMAMAKRKEEKQIEMKNLEKEVDDKKEPEEEKKLTEEVPHHENAIVQESSFRPNESQMEENTIEFMPSAYKQ